MNTCRPSIRLRAPRRGSRLHAGRADGRRSRLSRSSPCSLSPPSLRGGSTAGYSRTRRRSARSFARPARARSAEVRRSCWHDGDARVEHGPVQHLRVGHLEPQRSLGGQRTPVSTCNAPTVWPGAGGTATANFIDGYQFAGGNTLEGEGNIVAQIIDPNGNIINPGTTSTWLHPQRARAVPGERLVLGPVHPHLEHGELHRADRGRRRRPGHPRELPRDGRGTATASDLVRTVWIPLPVPRASRVSEPSLPMTTRNTRADSPAPIRRWK